MNYPLLSLCAATALFAGGCASEAQKKPAQSPPANVALEAESSRSGVSGQDRGSTSVAIAEEIQSACGIGASEAYFTYDSAKLRTADTDTLDKLATCFTSGPLRGRKMLLVGRADPRGEDEYNMLLGEHRAGAVWSGLVARSVAKKQLVTVSRGEMDADGRDEGSWALDRRVDVTLSQ